MKELFENYIGKLREVKVVTRQSSDGRSTISFRSFIVEFPFMKSFNINIGKLMAARTLEENTYLILEIADYVPMHYGMVNLSSAIPLEIRQEIMKRVEESWTDESSKEIWIDVYAIPIDYLMVVRNGTIEFKKGYLPPLPGTSVYLLNKETYQQFVCYKNGVSLGKVIGEDLNLTIDLEKAIKYHIGIFAFTGSGKSNLISTIVRKALAKFPDLKVVIFDVSMEYSVLLLDQLVKLNSRIASIEKIPLNPQDSGRKFIRTHVIPDDIQDLKDKIKSFAEILFNQKKIVQLYVPPQGMTYLTYGYLLEMIREQIEDKYVSVSQKPLYMMLLQSIDKLMKEKKLTNDDIVDETVMPIFDEVENTARLTHVKENSAILTFIQGVRSYLSMGINESEEYDVEKLAIEVLDSSPESPRLFVIEVPSLDEARLLVSSTIEMIFNRRKRFYSSNPKVLFILDEAQEFIPYDAKQKDNSELSSNAVEKLLRHGRKYYLHGLISTQRLAYLNTNVLQQLHTYFISTLPRPYDRQLIAETFGINDSLIDKILDLEAGQWLLVSFKSALPHDVPVFFKAENALDEVKRFLIS
ncbi:MAG: ATP-binding protein [Sulfolobaceae archaeon]|nr:ATP-binding protein [Sulfolobaceae archaeon]